MWLIQREPVTLATVQRVGGKQCHLQILLYKYLFVLARGAFPNAISCFPVALFCSPSKSSHSLISTVFSSAATSENFFGPILFQLLVDFPLEVNTLGSGKSFAPSLPSSFLEILPYFSLETRAEQAKPAQQAGRWLAALKDFSKLELS